MWKAKKLQCEVQHYEWGKHGSSCHVGRLFSRISGCPAHEDTAYAELWMGTHGSGPSRVVGNDDEDNNLMPLKKYIEMHPRVLGDKVSQLWGNDLPFLFKVLSVGKALSIQAHPDKDSAALLHQQQPNIYKDSNHKPEMALALTEFEALCGFVSPQELKDVIQTVPEIKCIIEAAEKLPLLDLSVDNKDDKDAKKTLKSAFTKLMTTSNESLIEVIEELKRRLNAECQVRCLLPKEKLVLRLEKQYPCDIGVLAAFFLNHMKLAPGEALYLDANEPHAYLYGECIECMATSDNVVRAGLTPKYRDVETLCSILTYKQGLPEILHGHPLNSFITRYSPPFNEFEVDRCILPLGHSVSFSSSQGPSIFLVLHGDGLMTQKNENESSVTVIREGDVFFVPAGTSIEFSSAQENEHTIEPCNSLHVYRAGINSKVFADDSNIF